jgi:hypothetical protein
VAAPADARAYLNAKIDLLLTGGFVLDSLEPSVIPQFESLVRERRPRLVRDREYDAVARVDALLASLQAIRTANRRKLVDVERLRDLIGEFRGRIRAAEVRGQRQALEHERALSRPARDREKEAEALAAAARESAVALDAEREDIAMGLPFRPSGRLCELRQTEARLARSRNAEGRAHKRGRTRICLRRRSVHCST